MTFLPLLGAVGVLLVPRNQSPYLALGASLMPFIINVWLYIDYLGKAGTETFAFLINQPWIQDYGPDKLDISFILGMDGISVYLVLLSTLIFPLSIYFSMGSVRTYLKGYYSLMLVLQTGVVGFFLALDMLLFYVFFEMVLIPMYFLIGIWGGKERIYASLKFFLYTLVGSLLMLIAIIYLCTQVPGYSFNTNYFTLLEQVDMGLSVEKWLFAAFALSFAIKVPLFPLHTWLPDAHTEAPTAGSVILAGVLLKMGSYGLVRFCLPLFPEASVAFASVMSFLAVIGIIYGGMAAMVQTDVKRLVAYSSVSHMGFIILGIFAFTEEAMSGAIIQMVNHGIATGALFLLVGMIYDRRHTRAIKDFQGIAKQMPTFAFIFMLTVMASVGLPGLNGFVGEFLVLIGSFQSPVIGNIYPILAATGVVIAAVYLLWMFRRVMFGPIDKEENRQLTDLNRHEVGVMLPLVILMFVLGLYATPFLKQISLSAGPLVEHVLEAGGVQAAAPAEEGVVEYRELPAAAAREVE